jgi:hypothetical protein
MLFLKFKRPETYAIDCLVYELDTGAWARYTLPETSAAVSADFISTGIIAQLVGNIDSLEGTIENLAGARNKLLVLAMTDLSYYLDQIAGVDRNPIYSDPVDSYYITRDFFGRSLYL